ncbi:MAG: glycogen(starch) synthase [Candidatus Saccharimonadales bacterium]|jgi:glycogen(starch) synthase
MLGWELPPHHSGGLGVACYEMCKGLASSGVDIDFVLPYSAEYDIDFMNIVPAHNQTEEEFRWAGGVYDSQYFSKTTVKILDQPLDLRKQHDLFTHNVTKIAKYAEFDVIHAHDWLTFKAGMAAKMATGKPLIAHVHATQFDQSAGKHGNPEIREIEYAGLTMADYIFAVSEYTKNVLIDHYGIDRDKIHVVHNGMNIDHEIYEGISSHHYLEMMKANGYKVVVNIGRKTIQKGLTHLLEAAAKVVSKNEKVLFLLAGGGEQEDELMSLAAKYGISKNVIFESWVSGKEWRDSFRIGDVFIMPSVSEPFGLTALEAIAFGSPTIVSKQSGVAEVLQNCYKVDFWDTEQMADMILSVVENESLAESMWESSYTEYKNNSWDKSVALMKDKYSLSMESAYNG